VLVAVQIGAVVQGVKDSGLLSFSAGDAGKVKRIRTTSRVRLAACNVRGEVRGPWVEAHGRIVLDSTLIVKGRRALRRKYGLPMRLTDGMATMTGRIRRRAYIEIESADSYS
jgi:PPOX class probable F420-dependent enzyme